MRAEEYCVESQFKSLCPTQMVCCEGKILANINHHCKWEVSPQPTAQEHDIKLSSLREVVMVRVMNI